MTIAFIGHGKVGAPLADHLQRAGHRVFVAARDAAADSVRALLQRNAALQVATPEQAVGAAEVVFLATPFAANETVIPPLLGMLAGKILVDCTNPVGPGLSHGLRSEQSGSARLQVLAPGASVVKAFTIYGYENLEDNRFPHVSVKPAMLFCGQDVGAKRIVGQLIAELGWEPLDVGGIEQALHMEHMTLRADVAAHVGGRGGDVVQYLKPPVDHRDLDQPRSSLRSRALSSLSASCRSRTRPSRKASTSASSS